MNDNLEWRTVTTSAGYKNTALYYGVQLIGSYLQLSDGYYPAGARKPSSTEEDAKRRVIETAIKRYRDLLSALEEVSKGTRGV